MVKVTIQNIEKMECGWKLHTDGSSEENRHGCLTDQLLNNNLGLCFGKERGSGRLWTRDGAFKKFYT